MIIESKGQFEFTCPLLGVIYNMTEIIKLGVVDLDVVGAWEESCSSRLDAIHFGDARRGGMLGSLWTSAVFGVHDRQLRVFMSKPKSVNPG